MSSVKLDLSKMLGYKILSHDDAAATSVQDAATMGPKLGAKLGTKDGLKLGAKLGTKLGAKTGEKTAPPSA